MKIVFKIIIGIGLTVALTTLHSCSFTQANLKKGALVTMEDGLVKAQIVGNTDSGAVLIYTWDKALKNRQPIKRNSLTLGSGPQKLTLQARPTTTDPAGFSSRFYGRAEWLRESKVVKGWIADSTGPGRQDFTWKDCWKGGENSQEIWSQIDRNIYGMPGQNAIGMMGNDSFNMMKPNSFNIMKYDSVNIIGGDTFEMIGYK